MYFKLNKQSSQHMAKVIFVPSWIRDVCKRNKITIDDICKYENFSKYLSQKDQAEFLAAQSFTKLVPLDCVFSKAVDACMQCVSYDLLNALCKSSSFDNSELKHVESLSMTDDVCKSLQTRLFSKDVSILEGDEKAIEPELVSVNENTVAIVISPGQFSIDERNGKNEILFLRAMESIVKGLLFRLPNIAVRRSDWFTAYVRALGATTPLCP